MEATMLAAESAWRILRLEHLRLRELSATIMRTLEVERWHQRDQQCQLLRALISGLQTFNDEAHRPKGVALLDALRQHPDMAGFLEQLTRHQEHCDHLLEDALGLLDAVEQGDCRAAERCAATLREHHRVLLLHLDQEDTLLLRHTNERLTPEEWSEVASSISLVMGGGGTPAPRR
jgi:hemerythrin-like domain-containing protein